MQKIIALNCSPIDNTRYAFAGDEYVVGEKLVVDVGGVICIGSVMCAAKQIDERELTEELANILRKATEQDLTAETENKNKAKDATEVTKQKVKQLKLKMKVVGAYYSLDSSKVVIDFTAEDRVDFRDLLKELAASLHTRIELRQIGQRDEVKIKGGLGPCGEICCCKRFLNDFGHVSVKMAKTQGLSLSPTKISGLCGRLMCCLAYENPTYEEVLKRMPKVGSTIKTPNGEGTVVYNDLLREMVSVRFGSKDETNSIEAFSLEELNNPEKYKTKHDKKDGEVLHTNTIGLNGAPPANRQASTQKLGEAKLPEHKDTQNIKSDTNKNKAGQFGDNQNNNQPHYGLQIVELGQETETLPTKNNNQTAKDDSVGQQKPNGHKNGHYNKWRKNKHKGKPNSNPGADKNNTQR